MPKVLIFGNSGSGKSTLAKQLAVKKNLAHFDLDQVAWLPKTPPTRMPLIDSMEKIGNFLKKNEDWVVEGCYSDLLSQIALHCDEMIYLNLSIQQCVENARKRPWEPHKYGSKQAQDANLPMLIDWIKQYETRTDTFSKHSHLLLYRNYVGNKKMLTCNT
ncbi:AAA family ATPase [Alteromonas sp. ASW11-130]|uniref:AAA family ATPase n=1 Tax=Alteromonas sp. ASW11-130 TaxID=3015775 RepID=UPI002241892A|nr:AAA family ATPase [Alteromonas sp. ASW11-130]MCW8092534.1 AAA family ATPase [Alteromonas sp. ASW11-130]